MVTDLVRTPLLGRLLRWRHSRLCFQIPLFLVAIVVLIDGFTGPQVGAMNLAGVLPWIHWRGLLILALLVLGNVFCLACPFTMPRNLARRWLPATRTWPRLLRNKWLAIAMLLFFLWAYEVFALWDSPWLTAWILVAYFVAAFAVDAIFQGAAFCKYVCPIGQFNFVQSLVSPFEIRIRDSAVCESCATRDCIHGRGVIPGCGMRLNVPRKVSNLDCTLCLDCVHACPHDNVGLIAVTPGASLRARPRWRFGLTTSRRMDLGALALVLTFGAFVNAALMTAPVVEWREQMLGGLGPFWGSTWLLVFGLIVAPGVLIVAATAASGVVAKPQALDGVADRGWAAALRYIYALVPLGFAMWVAHYSFHFLTSYGTIVPATQRFLGADAEWSYACCLPTPGWLLRLEIVLLDFGLLLSLYVGYRIARSRHGQSLRALREWTPWAVLTLLLFAVGVWIVFQPMQMRGAMPG